MNHNTGPMPNNNQVEGGEKNCNGKRPYSQLSKDIGDQSYGDNDHHDWSSDPTQEGDMIQHQNKRQKGNDSAPIVVGNNDPSTSINSHPKPDPSQWVWLDDAESLDNSDNGDNDDEMDQDYVDETEIDFDLGDYDETTYPPQPPNSPSYGISLHNLTLLRKGIFYTKRLDETKAGKWLVECQSGKDLRIHARHAIRDGLIAEVRFYATRFDIDDDAEEWSLVPMDQRLESKNYGQIERFGLVEYCRDGNGDDENDDINKPRPRDKNDPNDINKPGFFQAEFILHQGYNQEKHCKLIEWMMARKLFRRGSNGKLIDATFQFIGHTPALDKPKNKSHIFDDNDFLPPTPQPKTEIDQTSSRAQIWMVKDCISTIKIKIIFEIGVEKIGLGRAKDNWWDLCATTPV